MAHNEEDQLYIDEGRSDVFGEMKLKMFRETAFPNTTKNNLSKVNIFKQRKFTRQEEMVDSLKFEGEQKIHNFRMQYDLDDRKKALERARQMNSTTDGFSHRF